MNATNMQRRVEALEKRKKGGVVVWETHDDEMLTGPDGCTIHQSELPENGALNVIVKRFTSPDQGDGVEGEDK
ncbi:MAG: hypothetical protein AAFW98_14875 [Pseudomonadota bacterium]